MTEASVKHRIQSGIPRVEIVQLEASNGETYVATKGQKITGAIASLSMSSFTEEKCNAAFSGQTVTLNMIGSDSTDEKVFLLVVCRE